MNSISGLKRRAALVQAIRQFFFDRDYLEVDTPVRLPCVAPEPYIEPVRSGNWFLQTSPELCMKRLLAAGAPRIYQISKCFRRGERGNKHLSEFTMLEWYHAGIDYMGLMNECEELLAFLAEAIGLGSLVPYNEMRISLKRPWQRLAVADAFRSYAPVSMEEALSANTFDEVLVTSIEPHLGKEEPIFLFDYPASLGALARLKKNDPGCAERFELYAAGLEIANGFSELVDPAEQRSRFMQDREKIKAQGRDPGPLPERFLEELEYMPDAAGIALGIDRLAMFLFNAETIDKVISFTPEEL